MGADVLNAEEPIEPGQPEAPQRQTKHEIIAIAAGNRADKLTGPAFRTEIGAARKAAVVPRHIQLPPAR